jgi:glutamyl-tRNA synthetase
VRAESPADLAEHCLAFVVAAGLASADELAARADWFRAAALSEQERIRLYSELPERLAYLFAPDAEVSYAEKALQGARKHADRVPVLTAYLEWLGPRLEPLDPEALREATRAWVAERGLKMPALFQPLRCALTGEAGGVDLFVAMELLGAARVRARLESALGRL